MTIFYHKHSHKIERFKPLYKNLFILYLFFLCVNCGHCPNNCSNHGKCGPNGCECYNSGIYSSGYGGGDCSLSIILLK